MGTPEQRLGVLAKPTDDQIRRARLAAARHAHRQALDALGLLDQ